LIQVSSSLTTMRTFALLASAVQAAPASAVAATDSISVFFGLGCYWGSQNLFIEKFERPVLQRSDAELTSIAGYAGSSMSGPGGQVCYYNDQNISYYGALGHGEVTQVDVPHSFLREAFAAYFAAFVEYSPGVFGRPDYFDQGAGFREQIGFPGGIHNEEIMAALRGANVHNLTLVEGLGSDAETLLENKVYIMDSDAFAFAQAELCMQFFDDSFQGVYFNASYLALRPVLEKAGRLQATTCPHVYLCDMGEGSDLVV